MPARVLLILTLLGAGMAQAQLGKGGIPPEPGTISVEDLVQKPVKLTVKQESPIYFLSTMERAVGTMAPGTVVTLAAMSDTAFRVRGRARHGDVAGWMKKDAFLMPDPKLPAQLKALYERTRQVGELIAAHQPALGMTMAEIQEALGRPTRKSSRITAAGREDKLEYAIYEKVPQSTVGRAPDGQLFQTVIYVKVETGALSVSFKDGQVVAIEETKGSPLGGGAVKIVPGPVFFR